MKKTYPDDRVWVLEWSQKSNNLHVQPLAQTAGLNEARFILNAPPPNDYVVLAVGTYAEITHKADEIRPRVLSREPGRAAVL